MAGDPTAQIPCWLLSNHFFFHTDIFLFSFGKIITLSKQKDQEIECLLPPGLFHVALEDPRERENT